MRFKSHEKTRSEVGTRYLSPAGDRLTNGPKIVAPVITAPSRSPLPSLSPALYQRISSSATARRVRDAARTRPSLRVRSRCTRRDLCQAVRISRGMRIASRCIPSRIPFSSPHSLPSSRAFLSKFVGDSTFPSLSFLCFIYSKRIISCRRLTLVAASRRRQSLNLSIKFSDSMDFALVFAPRQIYR